MIKDTRDIIKLANDVITDMEKTDESLPTAVMHNPMAVVEAISGAWNIPQELSTMTDKEKDELIVQSLELLRRAVILACRRA
jgi:hypothetical protein